MLLRWVGSVGEMPQRIVKSGEMLLFRVFFEVGKWAAKAPPFDPCWDDIVARTHRIASSPTPRPKKNSPKRGETGWGQGLFCFRYVSCRREGKGGMKEESVQKFEIPSSQPLLRMPEQYHMGTTHMPAQCLKARAKPHDQGR